MRAEAFVHRDGTGTFTLEDGTVELIRAGAPADARVEVLRLAAEAATRAGQVLEVEAIVAGERSVILVGPAGEIADAPEDASGSPVSEAVARNDAQGLLAAGVRPAELVDADTLASTRLRLVEMTALGAEASPMPMPEPSVHEPPRAAAGTDPAAAAAPIAAADQPHGGRRRRSVVVAASAGLLLLGGSGIALAATTHHGDATSQRSGSGPTVASSTRLTAASPSAVSAASVASGPLVVRAAGRAGRVVIRVVDAVAASATLRLVASGTESIEHDVDLTPDGRATVRLAVAAATYHWTVTTSDGQRSEGRVVVAPAPSLAPTPPAGPPRTSSARPHRAAGHRPSAGSSARPKRTPKSTPKPKVHASVPASPLERRTT